MAIRWVNNGNRERLLFSQAPKCTSRITAAAVAAAAAAAAAVAAAAAAAADKLLQSCLTLCDPIDGSPPGSPVPGILQARTLEWVAISFSNA